MGDVELITNKFLSKEYLQDLFKRKGWSSFVDHCSTGDELHVADENGDYMFHIFLNKLDKNGNEVYAEDLYPEGIEETKKDPRFSTFKPYYNYISFFRESYYEVVDFFYMLKKEGLIVFYRFECGDEEMEELKNQL